VLSSAVLPCPEIRDLVADFQLQLGAEQRLQIDNSRSGLDDRDGQERACRRSGTSRAWALRVDTLPLALSCSGP